MFYIKVKDSTQNKILEEWLKGEISADTLKNQISKNDFEGYLRILNEVDSWQVTDDTPKFSKLISKREKKTKVVPFSFWKYGLAASVVFALMMFYFNVNSKNIKEYTTAFGETKEVVLPDGSVAILNSSSTLSFDIDQWQEFRALQLNGQCFFDVKKGNPFSVDFGEGVLQVLGTTFDVKSRESAFRVQCFTGKVVVENRQNKNCVLTQKEQVISVNGDLVKSIFNATSPDWMNDYYLYDDETLSSVLKDLILEYGISVSGISYDKRFTGKLPKNNLHKAIKMLLVPLDIEYSLIHKNLNIK